MMSAPDVPVSLSAAMVPTMVAGWPKHLVEGGGLGLGVVVGVGVDVDGTACQSGLKSASCVSAVGFDPLAFRTSISW